MTLLTGCLSQNAAMIWRLRIHASAVVVDVYVVSSGEELKATLEEDPLHKMSIGKKG